MMNGGGGGSNLIKKHIQITQQLHVIPQNELESLSCSANSPTFVTDNCHEAPAESSLNE